MSTRIRYISVLIPALAFAVPAGHAGAMPCGDMLMPAAQLKTVGRGYTGWHGGIDLLAPHGTPVRAAAAGTVRFVGRWYGYGNMVDVEHRDGTVTRYGHLSAFAPGLQPGERVATGEVLGRVGATGRASGPHLHFEVRVDGTPVDPKPALALAACDRGRSLQEPLEEARAPDSSVRPAWAK